MVGLKNQSYFCYDLIKATWFRNVFLMFLIFPKNQRNFLQISAQDLKIGQIIKQRHQIVSLIHQITHIIIVLQESAFTLLIWPLFRSWAEICQIFRWFFGKFKNIKKTFWNYLTFTWSCQHSQRMPPCCKSTFFVPLASFVQNEKYLRNNKSR